MHKLFQIDESFETWTNLYVHPGQLLGDPALIVKKEASDIYSFPLFTKTWCELLIDHAEQQSLWTDNRHKYYPTVDCELYNLNVEAFYRSVLQHYVLPIVRYVWRYTWENHELLAENFIARYTPDTQSSLATHNDEAWFSMVVTLNDNFEGGGTAFPRQNIKVHTPVGYATLHPGRLTHPHGGLPTTAGKRYITVSFMKATAGTNPYG